MQEGFGVVVVGRSQLVRKRSKPLDVLGYVRGCGVFLKLRDTLYLLNKLQVGNASRVELFERKKEPYPRVTFLECPRNHFFHVLVITTVDNKVRLGSFVEVFLSRRPQEPQKILGVDVEVPTRKLG